MVGNESMSAASRRTPPKVLIADDDPVMRTLMTEVLRAADYEVIEATDGALAVEMARAHRPDAIVVDLLMPKLCGTQVIQELRSSRALRMVPAIMVSGVDDVGYRVQALTAGANDFVVKPVAPAELVARVEAQLRIASTLSGGPHSSRDTWRRTVERDQAFAVVFVPIVDMASGHVVAEEAITRFHDGTLPGEAFQGDGAVDALVALELAVLRRAVEDSARLQAGVELYLKVSPFVARSPELPELLRRIGRPLVLEVTVNELFDKLDVQALRSVMPLDARIATDEVGVGYAGLAQILDVRPDLVRIDRILVSRVDEDPARQALVGGLVQFALATGCTLIAEGVERAEERDALLALGVSIGKGCLFGRPGAWPPPVPAELPTPCDLAAV
jgi:EAL domain-containing protein (putative c-di-GMP-specific phosphodiesterase class I)/ActR/RegA family two-component response regulator